VHALRNIHAALVPAGKLVDTQPVSARPHVTAKGARVGSLDMREWIETIHAVDERVNEANRHRPLRRDRRARVRRHEPDSKPGPPRRRSIGRRKEAPTPAHSPATAVRVGPAAGSKRSTRQTKRGSKRRSARSGGKKATSGRSGSKSASKRSSGTTRSRKKKSTR
jgi:hypothetical protein